MDLLLCAADFDRQGKASGLTAHITTEFQKSKLVGLIAGVQQSA